MQTGQNICSIVQCITSRQTERGQMKLIGTLYTNHNILGVHHVDLFHFLVRNGLSFYNINISWYTL